MFVASLGRQELKDWVQVRSLDPLLEILPHSLATPQRLVNLSLGFSQERVRLPNHRFGVRGSQPRKGSSEPGQSSGQLDS